MEVPITYPKENKETVSLNDAIMNYRSEMLPTYSQMTILGKQDVDIEKSFIPIGIVPENNPDVTPIQTTDEVLTQLRQVSRQILIKGMPGTGKTTFMRKLMHDFCKSNSAIFSVYFKASIFQEVGLEKKDLVDVLSEFVEAQLGNKRYSDIIAANDIFRQKKTCILIDGIDELSPEWQKTFLDKVNHFVIYYPKCMIILTARIYGMDSNANLQKFLPYLITELSDSDIENYVKANVSDADYNAVVTTIKNDEKLKELAKTPFMLALMCIQPECLKKGATRKVELYKETTEYLLGGKSWERCRIVTPVDTVSNLIKALQIIAVKFFKLDMNDQFPADEARFFIKNKLGNELGDATILDIICKKSGLLHYSNGTYSFVHRSIWEYYVALGMLNEPLENLLQMANVPNWEEPIRMFVGLTNKHDVEKVIKGLWVRNRSLTLRTLHELECFPVSLLTELYNELSHQERLNLVDTLKTNVYSLNNISQRKSMLIDTVLSVYPAERDCEVIYNYISLLEGTVYPECKELVNKILDLDNVESRQKKYFTGDYRFEMILVDGGTFEQGNKNPIDEREYPNHQVTIDSFYMSKNLITNNMYYDSFPFINVERAKHKTYSVNPFQPVNNVNWYEAYIFARWIGCELPTESEWEYCCRSGGKDDEYFTKEENIAAYGWYGVNSKNMTHDVGSKPSNSFGFCDMLGNLREWCQDWHKDEYYKECVKKGIVKNPKGPIEGEAKVLRGGCFDWAVSNLRPTYRNFNRPNVNFFGNGFRVVIHKKENEII